MAEGGRPSEDFNLETDDGRTDDAMQGGVNEISGGTHELTLQGGEFEQFIQKQVNETFHAATGKTGRPLKPGSFRISDVLSLVEREPISMLSRVFRAIHHSNVTGDKIVVAKITPADVKHQREAKIHFSVPHHKNIVERIATDTFDFRGQPSIYIAMECCDCNLYDHIKSQVRDGVPFDAQKYLSISRQIGVALNFLHSYKVVHGDLKPGNVLLILDKNVAKLCDFGLSRAISGDKTSTQLTLPQGGTTGWQGPEVLEGTTKLGFKSDIFPFGLVTYHCLSYGKHPYGDKSVSWNHYILNGENLNLDGMLISDADAAKVLLESMLNQNPADRPTAEEVLKHRIFASEGHDDTEQDGAGSTEQTNLPKSSESSFVALRNFFEKKKGQDDGAISKGIKRMNPSRATEGNSSTKPSSLGEIQRGVRRMKINFAYEAENSDELSLKPGDAVGISKDNLLSTSSKPSLEKKDSTEKSKTNFNYCKAKYDFLRRSDGELSLVEGEIVMILNKELQCHGWWEGEKEENGKIVKGLLPCSYVVELTADEAKDYVPQRQADSAQGTSKGKDFLAKVGSGKTVQAMSDEQKQKNITLLPEKDSLAKVGSGKTGQAKPDGERKMNITLLSGQDDRTISKGIKGMKLSGTTEGNSSNKSRPSRGKIQRQETSRLEDPIEMRGGVAAVKRLPSPSPSWLHATETSYSSPRRVSASLPRPLGRNRPPPPSLSQPNENDFLANAVSGQTDQAMSDEMKKKKITFLSERISVLLEHSEHLKASRLLEELASLQPTKELSTSLQMVECFLHLGRKREACEAIDAVRHITVVSHALCATDVFALGCDLCEKSSFVRAIISLRIASDLYKTNASSPDDVVNGIYKCICKTNHATKPLIKAGGRSQLIGLNFGVEYMKEMYEDLNAVNISKSAKKTLKQARSLGYIGFNYGLANQQEKRLKPLLTGIEMLKSQFGSDASKYRLFGDLLHNAGFVYSKLGKFSEAEKYYVKSIEAGQKAMDFANESEKQSCIEHTISNLKILRAKLGEI